MADGTVPAAQADRLHAIGAWLAVNGEAIFGTRPWTRAEGVTGDGTPVRFTASRDGTRVYAIVLGPLPPGEITLRRRRLPPRAACGCSARRARSTPRPSGADLRIQLPATPPAQAVHVFELSQ